MKITWRLILIAMVLIIILGAGSAYFFFRHEVNAPNDSISQKILIKVNDLEKTEQISANLATLNLIKNSRFFNFYEFFHNSSIKSGYYEITPKMSMAEIADLLNSGKTKIVKVTFPEGYRLEQIGQKLDSLGIVSYTDFISVAKPSHVELEVVIPLGGGAEGKLFPDTYFFDPRMTADEVIAKMLEDYTMRTANLNVSAKDLVLASIVEKEAANDTDRGIIAGIYQNRITAGMKLQSDPTVSYGRDSNNIADLTKAEILDYTFWRPAKTIEFTSVKSLYNTYQNIGLPPAPICNPGLASIKAALSPTPSNYYYFLYGSDGKLHPAKTSAEHSANVAKYL